MKKGMFKAIELLIFWSNRYNYCMDCVFFWSTWTIPLQNMWRDNNHRTFVVDCLTKLFGCGSRRGPQVVRAGGGAARVARVERVGRGRVQRALAGGGGAPAAGRLPRAAAAHQRPPRRRARALRPRYAECSATSMLYRRFTYLIVDTSQIRHSCLTVAIFTHQPAPFKRF